MKKLLSITTICGMALLVACGPSAEDQAKEKARLDSIEAAKQQAYDDSVQAAADRAAAEAAAAEAAAQVEDADDGTTITKGGQSVDGSDKGNTTITKGGTVVAGEDKGKQNKTITKGGKKVK